MRKLFFLILLVIPSVCWGQFATLSPGGTSDSIGVDVDGGAMDSWLYPAYLREGTNVTFTVTGDTLTIAGQVGAGTADTTWIHNDANDDSIMASNSATHLEWGSGIDVTIAGDTATVIVDDAELTLSNIGGAVTDGQVPDSIAITLADGSVTYIKMQTDYADSLGNLYQNETVAGNWVNTANPWADNEIATSGNWNTAYGWGDWSVTVGKITDDTTNYQTAYGWGDHSAQNYLDNDDANVDTAAWNAANDAKADTAGDGTNIVDLGSPFVIQKGPNIILTVDNDTLTIEGAAGGGDANKSDIHDSLYANTPGYITGDAIDDSIKTGWQIFQKIDTTDAVIDSAVGAERAAVAVEADSALGFTHDGIKDYHVDWGTGAGQVSTDDVTEGSSNLFDQALPDSADWSTAYSWGDHSTQNYLDEDDLGSWKVYYGNGTSAFTELALGADGTYLKSTGASSAPTFATPPGGDPGSAIDDSIKNGWQIYQKIDTTDAVIDSAVGAERASVSGKADSALAFTHQGIKKYHTDSTSENFVFDGAYHITSAETDSQYMSKKYIDNVVGGGGTSNADSIVDVGVQDTTNNVGDGYGLTFDQSLDSLVWTEFWATPVTDPTDNYVLKIDTDPTPDTLYWAVDETGGLSAQSVKGNHVDSTAEDFVFDGAYHITSAEADSAYLTHGGAAATYLTGNESITLSGDATGSGATAITVTVVDDLHDHVYSNIDETTSANWRTRVSDETGTGAWVFGTSPTFTTDITSPLVIGGTATTADLSLKTTSGVGATGADMHFLVGNNGATEAMTILNNGNVGIGTTDPSSITHIKANVPGTVGSHPAGQVIIQNPANSVTSNVVITAYESDAGGAPDQQLWYLGSSSTSNSNITFLNRRSAFLALGTNDIVQMTIDENGNVGIGETSPDEKLHVTGNSATLKLEDDSGNDAAINVGNSQLCLAIDPDDLVVSSDICFDIDGDEVARFHQSKDFGIGTLSPPERLSVVGNIATGDTATGDMDVFHYFSTDASWVTEYLKWDDGNARFELSDDLYVGGTVLSLDTLTKSFVIASIDDTFDFPFWQTKRAITITAVSAVCTGGTNVVGALQEYNATGTSVDAAVDGDWTITTSEYTDASFTNAGIDAGDWLGWKTTSVSGSVMFFSITFEYTEQ